MAKKLERVRKVRKKDFDKMVEQLLKTPPLKNEKDKNKENILSDKTKKEEGK